MAAIKITQFGGLAPSVDPRNLPADGAQVATNLDMRFNDFRPSRAPGASVATVPAGSVSIFRTPSGVWLHSTTDTDYVNGQVPDAASERVYLTGRSAYPEAWQGGSYRRLGVPPPVSKPTLIKQAVDEFDQSDADAAQKAATDAVLAAIAATDTDVLLGNAAPGGVGAPVATPDPLYAQVALHLRFDELVGGRFVDTSPQGRVITHEANVALSAGSDGPLGAAGNKYARLAGGADTGIFFDEVSVPSRTDPWTIDAWISSDVTLNYIGIEAAGGNLRKVLFKPNPNDNTGMRTLFATQHSNFSMQLLSKRADGSPALTAGVPAFLSIQNTGANVQVFLDGVLVGATPNTEKLELSVIGRATNQPNEQWLGKIDEVRVTKASRGYVSPFTPPTLPFSTGAVPTGFWATHGDPATYGLPTNSADDAAYLVQLVASGGGWVTANPADDYLRTGSFGGAQVTYSGAQYWAVPVAAYRAAAKTIDLAALDAALAAVDNPASPGTPLLTSGQATTLAAAIVPLYNTSADPLLGLVNSLNTQQASVQAQLATPAGAAPLSTQITLLQSASAAVTAHFTGLDAQIKVILTSTLGSIFGSISSQIVTRNIETRGYIVTYLTDWDEESAPSAPSDLIEVDQNDEVLVTTISPPPGRHIVGWLLYRSSTTNSGADWQLVEDKEASNAVLDAAGNFRCFDIGNLSYTDSLLQAELQESCQSITWAEPPANLRGLVGLPNGIMAGFFDNVLCFSEPYAPYAWPVEYQLSLEFKIVGIGVFGQTAVVLTQGNPYYASGADSASMSTQKLESPQACIAKRTIAAVEGGVIFASPDGLCLASPAGIQNLTQGAFSRDDWQAAVGTDAFGAYHDGRYFLFTGV